MKILNLYAGIGGNRKLWPKEVELYSWKSYCTFWDNWLKEIKWCNKDVPLHFHGG